MSSNITMDALAVARATIDHAARTLQSASSRLDSRFADAVELLAETTGKVVTSGVGKSGLVAQRLAATLTSTGSPAVFLHPTDAAHGDAGILQKGDCAIFISKSGGSQELEPVLEIVERLEIPRIVLTTQSDSPLGRGARVVVATGEIPESAPLELVPTTSATVFQVLGDAMAMALVARRGFTDSDFAFLHPGGVLGRSMRLTASDLMHSGAAMPVIDGDATLRQVLLQILEKGLGVVCVINDQNQLQGIITDGDVKRIVLQAADGNEQAIWRQTASEVMSRNPRTCEASVSVARAVREMEENPSGAITSLVVIDDDQKAIGILHLHDCLRAGLGGPPR